ncbi:MAG: hypothetical protein AAED33_11740 [Paracoccaceae bacterium]|jgi:uncharacterized membrane protein YdbT with pleckstrin-like domain
MSIFSRTESTLLPFVTRVQDTIGDVIFSFTGVMTGDLVNQVVFYFIAVFVVYLAWLLLKPAESVYNYRPQHHH